ncbi:MAG: polysaccharide biosynthesis/export family protein [Candidatus Binatus sp.]
MKLGIVEFVPQFVRAGAPFTALIMVAVITAMTMAVCGCFDSSAVRQKVVPREAVKDTQPYRIGADDELEIVVWNQPQLSGKVIVASDGTIAMPLIGRVPAAGQTPEQIKADLEKRYAQYVHDPNATVRVSDPASHVFYVVGEVNKPGAYKLHSGEFLSQALAEAGGLGEFADPSKIRILRHKETETVVLTVNYNLVRSGGDVSADVPVEPGDTVSVP